MIVKAWNNGSHRASGAGYGLRISRADRDKHFRREWDKVAVQLPGWDEPLMVNITPSFWRNCTELRHKEIGVWLRDNGFAPWPKGQPPEFQMEPVGSRQFRVKVKKRG